MASAPARAAPQAGRGAARFAPAREMQGLLLGRQDAPSPQSEYFEHDVALPGIKTLDHRRNEPLRARRSRD